jgi:hypothetical protein
MRVVCFLVALAACANDPTLHVTVVHPTGSQVAKTVVSVYEGSFGCLEVEFGDLTPDQLSTSLVAEDTIPYGNLDGISRTDPKIVVARGYGAAGGLVTEGCAEKAAVTGADELEVDTVATATASVALADPTHADVFGLSVTTTDPDGRELDGRPVSWRVYAPIGAQPAASTALVAPDSSWQPALPTCTHGGVAVIHPVPPSTVGGYAIQTRVAWAAEPVPLYTAIVANVLATTITPPPKVERACAIGHSASTQALMCLTAGGATQFTVGSDGSLTAGATTALTNPVALYALDSGEVWAIASNGNPTRVFPSTLAGACTSCAGVTIDDAVLMPACGGSSAKLLLHNTTNATQLQWMDPTGGAMTSFPVVLKSGELSFIKTPVSAGCASELDPTAGTYTTQQVAVIDLTRPLTGVTVTSRAHFACTTASCQSIDLPLAGNAVGFSGGTQPYVIGTAVDATGVVLTSLLMAKNGAGDHWVELAREPAASLPHRLVAGQFDDDGGIDKVWDMKTKAGGLVEIAYSRMIGDSPLEGLSSALEEVDPPRVALDVLMGDVTGDMRDDIVIVDQTVDGAQTGVTVLPAHAAAPVGTLITDETCMP